MSELGRFLKESRIMRGYGIREVADKVGISRGYLLNIENGSCLRPFDDVLERISDLYGIDFGVVMGVAGRGFSREDLFLREDLEKAREIRGRAEGLRGGEYE